MNPVAIFGPTVVAGLLSMAGVALKVWFDGRDKRRRGQRDIDVASTQLAFCREWLAVRENLGSGSSNLPIPQTMAGDLTSAYERARTGSDLLAQTASEALWGRIAASISPGRRPETRAGRGWRTVYWIWFALSIMFTLAIIAAASESRPDPRYGATYNFTLSVVTSLVMFGLFCVAPLALFRSLARRASRSAAR